MKKTLLLSGFPGTGKSYFFQNEKELSVLDSDSSTFDKSDFPRNYIEHIKQNIGLVDVILISSHKVVRDALVDNNLEFTLVFPGPCCSKDEYIKRFTERGDSEEFIALLDTNWNIWINELKEQDGCKKIRIRSTSYISTVMNSLN